MFSNESDEWETPNDFYKMLNERFCFSLDPCATKENHKCSNYYTIENNGLKQNWEKNIVFVNPPYSNNKEWVEKCYNEGQKPHTTVVLLVPSRTDTKYWHEYCMKSEKIFFVKGRLKFSNQENSAPFPSAVVVFSKSFRRFSENGTKFPIIETIGKR